jgi:uncharacterized membrane protein
MIDLVIMAIFCAALVPLVELSSGALRVALGLAFALFSPGYGLIAALFPKMSSISDIERVVFSFGLSIAVVPLIGLTLNYTPWGIRLQPILVSLLVFVVAMIAVAWYRRWRLPPEERFQVRLSPVFQSLSGSWVGHGWWDRLLTVALLVAILSAIGILGYVIAQPKVGERFTEFYCLGLESKAENYPQKIVLGDEVKVILGIVNHEHDSTTYMVEIAIDGEKAGEVGHITLNHEEKWERELGFAPVRLGDNQKVEFRLYKGVSSDPYLTLHLWIDVEEVP